MGTLEDILLAHISSVADGGKGKKRELGCRTFYDHKGSFAFCRGFQALTQDSSTFHHPAVL